MEKLKVEDSEDLALDGLQLEVKDGQEVIKGGKMNKLMQRLTEHTINPNEMAQDTFLLTFSSFSTSEEILDQLLKRYDVTPAFGLDHKRHELEIRTKIAPIRHQYVKF